jgi:pimeloyl-ACP methyl ester carboxylesterase
LRLADGRALDYMLIGAPKGRSFVWLPNDVGMHRWTARAEAALLEQGLRMIVPVRAGYGKSSPIPPRVHVFENAARDILALLDSLGVKAAPIVSLGQDFCLAMYLANMAPTRCLEVIACGPLMPAYEARHYERMHLWQRFIGGNARFAAATLPFLVNAGFMLARRIGKKRFVQAIYGNCAADIAASNDPEIMEALEIGSEPVLSEKFSAHRAFAAEVLAMNTDWSHMLEQRQVPVTLFCGMEDGGAPIANVREFAQRFTQLRVVAFPAEGKLVCFRRWPDLVDEIERALAVDVTGARNEQRATA